MQHFLEVEVPRQKPTMENNALVDLLDQIYQTNKYDPHRGIHVILSHEPAKHYVFSPSDLKFLCGADNLSKIVGETSVTGGPQLTLRLSGDMKPDPYKKAIALAQFNMLMELKELLDKHNIPGDAPLIQFRNAKTGEMQIVTAAEAEVLLNDMDALGITDEELFRDVTLHGDARIFNTPPFPGANYGWIHGLQFGNYNGVVLLVDYDILKNPLQAFEDIHDLAEKMDKEHTNEIKKENKEAQDLRALSEGDKPRPELKPSHDVFPKPGKAPPKPK